MSRDKKNYSAGCALMLVMLLLVPAFFLIRYFAGQDGRSSSQNAERESIRTTSTTGFSTDSSGLAGLSLYSRNAILVRLDDGSVLLQKNSTERIFPASLTKIMTAIVAIENIKDLQTEITLSKSIFKSLNQANASQAGFVPGETATANDLLYGALLPSGGECCVGLAEHISGSEQGFVSLMNRKAAALGMTNTHFANATGLQDGDHYTTVHDLAVLLRYALKNQAFRAIFTSSRHTVGATNKHPNGFTFHNTLFEKLKNPAISGGSILGGKTGYTNQAGLCLASLARENGNEYILVTAGAKGDHDTEQYDVTDALTVYNGIGRNGD